MVGGEVGELVSLNAAVFLYYGVIPFFYIIEDGIVSVTLKYIQETLEFQAGGVVPFESTYKKDQFGGIRTSKHFALHKPYGRRGAFFTAVQRQSQACREECRQNYGS